jgi:hypothetical protein
MMSGCMANFIERLGASDNVLAFVDPQRAQVTFGDTVPDLDLRDANSVSAIEAALSELKKKADHTEAVGCARSHPAVGALERGPSQ